MGLTNPCVVGLLLLSIAVADGASIGGKTSREFHPPPPPSDGRNLLGTPGKDYPIFATVPPTSFKCVEHMPGYYADVEALCQVFHICQDDGRQDRFLCPNGTLFNQNFLVCDWFYNVDCSQAPSFYFLNQLFQHHPSSSLFTEEDYINLAAAPSAVKGTSVDIDDEKVNKPGAAVITPIRPENIKDIVSSSTAREPSPSDKTYAAAASGNDGRYGADSLASDASQQPANEKYKLTHVEAEKSDEHKPSVGHVEVAVVKLPVNEIVDLAVYPAASTETAPTTTDGSSATSGETIITTEPPSPLQELDATTEMPATTLSPAVDSEAEYVQLFFTTMRPEEKEEEAAATTTQPEWIPVAIQYETPATEGEVSLTTTAPISLPSEMEAETESTPLLAPVVIEEENVTTFPNLVDYLPKLEGYTKPANIDYDTPAVVGLFFQVVPGAPARTNTTENVSATTEPAYSTATPPVPPSTPPTSTSTVAPKSTPSIYNSYPSAPTPTPSTTPYPAGLALPAQTTQAPTVKVAYAQSKSTPSAGSSRSASALYGNKIKSNKQSSSKSYY